MYIKQSPTKPIKSQEEIINDLRWKWLNVDNKLEINYRIQENNLLDMEKNEKFSDNEDLPNQRKISLTIQEAEENWFYIIDDKIQTIDDKIQSPHAEEKISYHWI